LLFVGDYKTTFPAILGWLPFSFSFLLSFFFFFFFKKKKCSTSDVSGIVEEVGSSVSRFKKGDHVCAYTSLSENKGSAFAEYCLAPEHYTIRKPSSLSFEVAAGVSVAYFTAASGIYHNFGVPIEPKAFNGEYFLVWGGSSSVGSYAVQLATLAGFQVIATCSLPNFEVIYLFGFWNFISVLLLFCFSF